MTRLTYAKEHRLDQLADELVAALPGLIVTDADGRRTALHRLSGDGTTLTAEVPDDITEAVVAAVVTAHVPNANYGRDTAFEAAVTWLKGTAWPKLSQSPPVALTASEQTAYNKALLVVVRRLFQELR